jgi:alkaline phosphatase D
MQARAGEETAILGQDQVDWLLAQLKASKATWKAVFCDMPLGLHVPDGNERWEAVANGDNGAARGRELEIARLLKGIKDPGIENVVWFTADVHYTAAHYYDPSSAVFDDFEPFWEFVSGPLNAGSFGPNKVDETFGLQVMLLGAHLSGILWARLAFTLQVIALMTRWMDRHSEDFHQRFLVYR